MDDILATVETHILSKYCGKSGPWEAEEELWWERGASSSPLRYVRDIAVSHPHSPNSGMGRTVSCSPFSADDSNHLLLSDLVQTRLILYHIAERKTLKTGFYKKIEDQQDGG